MSPSATIMSAALLLAGPDGGEVRRLRGIRVAKEPPVLELERIKVNRAPVNEDHNSELALSARHAGTVALHLLFRELNYNDPVTRLWFDIEPPSMAVTGRSAELFFGLTTYLHLGRDDLPAGIPNASFIATGTLDRDGNVGSVDQVAVKVRAALAAGEPSGAKLFYPRADEGQIDDTLRLQCRDHGLLLCAVDRIDEALAMLGAPIIGSWPSGVSPFRSLQVFDTSFSRVFFGRQREVAALATLLDARAAAGKPGALIIGASGAGKSSFCLAGLIPALAKSRPGLDYAVWRPRDAVAGRGDDPAEERHIAQSIAEQWRLRDANQPGLAMARPTDGIDSLDSLPDCLAPATGDGCIFIVDQFEELFTLAFTPEARIAFARFLQSLQAKGIWVIGTLRSEFYPQYLELADADGAPVLTPMFEGDGQYNLPRMSREALAQVIVRPAELAGLCFEQRSDEVSLAQALLADAMATDDALPLLGFALQTLYDEAERPASGDDREATSPRTLTFAAYDRLGRLSGAIGVVAARAYGALDAAAQAELPALLSALAVPSPDGSRETARPAPIAAWPVGSAGRRLIDALTDIRVLVSERGAAVAAAAQVRVAHEALFSHWDVAAQVLSESRQNRLLIEDFRQRAAVWDADGRPRGALLSSQRDVANGRAVRPLLSAGNDNGPLIAFIDMSIVRSRRQQQFLYSSAAAIAVILTGSTGWALVSKEQAQIATAQARQSAAGERAARILAQTNLRKAETNELAARASAYEADRQRDIAERAADAERLASVSAQLAAASERQQRNEATRQRDLARAATQVANDQRQIAERQTREAERQKSLAIIQLAEQTIHNGDAMTGMLLARSQLRVGDEANWTGAAQTALRHAILENREMAEWDIHGSMVSELSVTSNGRQIVTRSKDGLVSLSILMENELRSIPFPENTGLVNFAAFSSDGRLLVTAAEDGIVRLWGLDEDQPILIAMLRHSAPVKQAVFSNDGQRLVSYSTDGAATLWALDANPASPTRLDDHSGEMIYATFSPDARQLFTVSGDGPARLWTLDGDRIGSIEIIGHEDLITHADFSPDGRQLVTASLDSTARLWNLDVDPLQSLVLEGHSGGVFRADFSYDGRQIITASLDQTARLWTIDSSQPGLQPRSVVLEGHSEGVVQAEFHPYNGQIITGSSDRTARIWTMEGDRALSVILAGHRDEVNQADFDLENGQIITSSLDRTARLWAPFGGSHGSALLEGHVGRVNYVAYSPDGQHIASASSDRSVLLWTVDGSGRRSVALEGHDASVDYIAFSPDSRQLVTASNGRTTLLWTLGDGQPDVVELEGHAETVTHASFSSDGRYLVTASNDAVARRWQLDGDEPQSITLVGHTAPVIQAIFVADSPDIATVSEDGTALLWKWDENRLNTTELAADSNGFSFATFSTDGRQLVTISSDRAVRWWAMHDGSPRSVALEGHDGQVNHVIFSPDGHMVVTTSDDRTARIWTWDEDSLRSVVLEGHAGPVTNAIFSPDGLQLVTASDDGTARLWILDGDRPTSVAMSWNGGTVEHMAFRPDGRQFAMAFSDGKVRLWPVATSHQLLALSDQIITRCLTRQQIERFGLDPAVQKTNELPCR